MMNKAGYDIGFDVGGSHIAGALFSGEKELMRLQTPYPKNEPDKASGIIAQMIEALADAIPEAAEDKLSLLNVVGIAAISVPCSMPTISALRTIPCRN